ncbi:MAG TPA: YihY/virulence factor BrkB family protein [Candidatus Angelobacter sp.]|nr:YihY/virulence factor BrkB family protein [Candidatus Angelobacter sp.]
MKSGIDKKAVIQRIFRNLFNKHLPLAAAGMAYYFLMALFPALVVLTAVMVYLPVQNGMQAVTAFLAHLVPPPGLAVIDDLLRMIAPHRTSLLSFGLITTVWLTSVGFKGVIWGLDMVYDDQAPRPIWVSRVLAFGLTFAVGLLLLLGVFLTVVSPVLQRLVSRVVPIPEAWARIWPYVQWSLSAVLLFAAIELLYILVPRIPAAQRVTVPGAVFAALAWLALAWGLGFYLKHFGEFKSDNVLGLLATPIAFMGWMYWSAGAILIGAEINSSLQYFRSLAPSGVEQKLPPYREAA